MSGTIESRSTGPAESDRRRQARPRKSNSRRRLWTVLLVLAAAALIVVGIRQVGDSAGAEAAEDAKLAANQGAPAERKKPAEHPLDPALKVAREGLAHLHENVRDYTAIVVKRERINGKLGEIQYMFAKIRNRKTDGDKILTPFSVYLKFQKPKNVAGREVIWVEDANGGKLIAHEAGLAGFIKVSLDPDGFLAMRGNRYPIKDIGVENLVAKLIEKGEEDRQAGDCQVQFYDNAKVDGRRCRLIEIRHPEKKPQFDFFIARIFIDSELNVPLRYAAYTWPTEPGGDPVLEEEYTYTKLKLNVGLTDEDFDSENPDYNYP